MIHQLNIIKFNYFLRGGDGPLLGCCSRNKSACLKRNPSIWGSARSLLMTNRWYDSCLCTWGWAELCESFLFNMVWLLCLYPFLNQSSCSLSNVQTSLPLLLDFWISSLLLSPFRVSLKLSFRSFTKLISIIYGVYSQMSDLTAGLDINKHRLLDMKQKLGLYRTLSGSVTNCEGDWFLWFHLVS